MSVKNLLRIVINESEKNGFLVYYTAGQLRKNKVNVKFVEI